MVGLEFRTSRDGSELEKSSQGEMATAPLGTGIPLVTRAYYGVGLKGQDYAEPSQEKQKRSHKNFIWPVELPKLAISYPNSHAHPNPNPKHHFGASQTCRNPNPNPNPNPNANLQYEASDRPAC